MAWIELILCNKSMLHKITYLFLSNTYKIISKLGIYNIFFISK